MRSKLNRLWSVLLATILITGIIPFALAASDLSDEFQLITGVEITVTDNAGVPLAPQPVPIPVDAYFQLKYNFKLPADAEGTIVNGDYYYLDLPPQIKVAPFTPIDLVYGSETLATWEVVNDPNNRIKLVFTDAASHLSNITGSFWMNLLFKKDDIGPGGSTPIEFDFGGNIDGTVNVGFEEDTEPVTITKSGSYNSNTGRITWTIVVNENNKPLTNLVVKDTILPGQTYVPGSYTITPSATVSFANSGGQLSWAFTSPNPVTNKRTITFQTTGTLGPNENKATMDYVWGTPVTKDSNTATVTIPIEYIKKTGVYDEANKRIKWTVDLNKFDQNMGAVTFKDTLPAGLTLNPPSLDMVKQGTSSPVDTVSALVSGQVFTANLGTITERKTLTYFTDVDPGQYNTNTSGVTFTNTAEVEHSGPGGGPGSNGSGIGVGVPFSMLAKSFHAYNAATGQITWRLLVNRNRVSINNPLLTDTIPSDQEYVPGSYAIIGTVPSGLNSPVPVYTPATGVLTIQYNGSTSDSFTIEFKTQIKDKLVWQNNETKTYENNATLTVTGRDPIPASASKQINSVILRKAFGSYNHLTRELTWTITVNENKNSLTNVVVTDYIPAGYEFVSITYANGNPLPGGHTIIGAHPVDAAAYPAGVRVNLGAISDTVQMKITTKLTDLDILLNENGQHTAYNRVGVTHTDLPGGREITVPGTFTTTVANKGYSYTPGNRFIDWVVRINQANLSLSDVIMTDTLQEGLELDLDHIHLYQATLNADGTLTQGAEVAIGPANVQYDAGLRLFTFTMPVNPVAQPYLLRFRTRITGGQATYTNSVNFAGSSKDHTSGSGGVSTSWQGSGQQIDGEVGSISISKIDDVTHEPLQGAVFELYNAMGLLVATVSTGEDGTAMLYDRALLNKPYTIKELTAPHGYTGPVYNMTVTLDNTPGRQHVTVAFTNTRNGGYHTQIEAVKTWSGLAELDGTRPNVWFELWRVPVVQGVTGAPEKVPGAALKQLNGTVTTVSWNTLPVNDLDGNPYTYSVKEVDQNGADYVPEGYEKTESGLTVENRSLKQSVSFSKTAVGSGAELVGAHLEVFAGESTTGLPIESWTSTATARSFLLVPGIYTMVETQAPLGYEIAETITFRVNANGSVDIRQGEEWAAAGNATVRMEDAYSVNFSKTAINGTEELVGAALSVYEGEDSTGTRVESWTSGTDQKVIGLGPGTYTMVETSAPLGYEIAESITFRVNANGSVDIRQGEEWVAAGNATVRMEDAYSINFSKTAINGTAELENALLRVYEGEGAGGTLIESWTSGTAQKVIGLGPGIYTMVETSAPLGYEIAESITFRVNANGSVDIRQGEGWAAAGNATVRMEDAYSISFSKTAINGTDELEGALLSVYEGEGAGGTLIESWTSGTAQKVIGLGAGIYTMVETTAPMGYEVAESITFRVNADGSVDILEGEEWVPAEAAQVRMEDAYTLYDIDFSKTAVNGTTELPGATLGVYRGDEATEDNLVEEWVSGEDVKNISLPFGIYTMVETTAPMGYEIAESITFRVNEDGTIDVWDPEAEAWVSAQEAQVRMEDDYTRYPINFSKTAVNGTKELPGAKLRVYRGEGAIAGNLVEEWISATTTKTVNLPFGVYAMVEITAPNGYEVAENITFRVNEDGSVEIKEGTRWVPAREAQVRMEDRLTPVDPPSITYPTIEVPLAVKKVLRNGTLKAGAYTFVLKDAKGTVLAEATNQKDGTVVFPNRTFSRQVSNYIYTITETAGNSKGITYDKTVYTIKVTTWPVSGKLSYRVDVEKDGTPYAGGVVFTNIRNMPSTGDNQPMLIFILTAVALTGMLLAYGMKRRRTGSDKR